MIFGIFQPQNPQKAFGCRMRRHPGSKMGKVKEIHHKISKKHRESKTADPPRISSSVWIFPIRGSIPPSKDLSTDFADKYRRKEMHFPLRNAQKTRKEAENVDFGPKNAIFSLFLILRGFSWK